MIKNFLASRQVGGEEGVGEGKQKFFPIITCQNKFDELLVVCQELIDG